METTEHITESYIRYVKKWFTNSNIKCKGGKEIDIIAIDSSGDKYHIECGVTHLKSWALKSNPSDDDFEIKKKGPNTIKKWKRRNSVDFFIEEKFDNPFVLEKLKEFDFTENYKKIIVVWCVKSNEVIEYAKEKGIEVWCLKEKIIDLMKALGDTYYEDDINRTLQLIWKANLDNKTELYGELAKIISSKEEFKKVRLLLKELI